MILTLVFITWCLAGLFCKNCNRIISCPKCYWVSLLLIWHWFHWNKMQAWEGKGLNLITLCYLQFTTKCTPISYFLSKRLLNTFSWNEFISTFENIPFQFSFANHFTYCMKLKREILEVVSIQYLCPEIILHFKSLKFCYRRKNELSHNNMEQFYYSICSAKNKKLDIFYWNVLYYSEYLHICK